MFDRLLTAVQRCGVIGRDLTPATDLIDLLATTRELNATFSIVGRLVRERKPPADAA
jgi:hypothetical protein